MEKLCIILLISISLLILTSCSAILQAETTTTINPLEQVVSEKDKEIKDLNGQLEDLTARLSLAEGKNRKYDELINNLNKLLKNVYYGYASNSNYIVDGFTAFSMKYNNKYYLITVGHAVEKDGQKYTNFKFKANFSDNWLYPKLLVYDSDYVNSSDYAIFDSDKITDGLIPEIGRDFPEFVLGNCKLNIVRTNTPAIPGESGSPVINLDGEATGMVSSPYTSIDVILKAIDELE